MRLVIVSAGVLILLSTVGGVGRVGATAGSASAGGPSIAAAPELARGQSISGGSSKDGLGNYQEYWRVTAKSGDVLTLALSSQSSNGVFACLYTPAVTDSNLSDAECRASGAVQGAGSQTLTFNLSADGRWTLALRGATNQAQPFPYALTASIASTGVTKQPTTTTLRAVRRARIGARVLLLGSVKPFSSGRVKLRAKAPGTTAWRLLATVPLTADSQFSYPTRFRRVGTYRLRATYAGDATHLASTGSTTILIHR
jgi:hypothetical protein